MRCPDFLSSFKIQNKSYHANIGNGFTNSKGFYLAGIMSPGPGVVYNFSIFDLHITGGKGNRKNISRLKGLGEKHKKKNG